MQIKQLTHLIAIVEAGSLSRAAARLGVAQPALSRQIRQLEQELGVALLYRHGRGAVPTEEGARFIDTIRPLLIALSKAKAEIAATNEEPSGEIRLGLPPSVSATIGANLVRHFAALYPRMKLNVLDGFSGFVNEWLVSGQVDMAVLNLARCTPSIRTDHLLTVDLFLVGTPVMLAPFAQPGGTVPTAALQSLPLMLPGRHHGLRRELETAARTAAGFELQTIYEIDSLVTLNELARSGFGVTVLPYGAIDPANLGGHMSCLRLVDPPVTQSFVLAYSLHRPVTIALQRLADAIRLLVGQSLARRELIGRLAEEPRTDETGTQKPGTDVGTGQDGLREAGPRGSETGRYLLPG